MNKNEKQEQIMGDIKLLSSQLLPQYSSFHLNFSTNRYAVRLLTPSSIFCKQASREVITEEDVKTAASLFMDAKSSAQILAENSDKYMK